MSEFKWLSGAYEDGWLSIRARASVKGIEKLSLELYLPPMENWNQKQVSFKFDGTETQQALLTRGKSTVVVIEPPEKMNEMTLEIVSDHREESAIDVRMLGAMCVSVGINDNDRVPQSDVLEHVGIHGVLPGMDGSDVGSDSFLDDIPAHVADPGARARPSDTGADNSLIKPVLQSFTAPSTRLAQSPGKQSRVPPSKFTQPVVIDQRTRAKVCGWVERIDGQDAPSCELLADGIVVDICQASAPNQGHVPEGETSALSFELRIPLALRNKPAVKLEVRRSGVDKSFRPSAATYKRQMRVLYLANANSKVDGSRVYRSELPAQALRSVGWDASVMSELHAREQRIDIKQNTDPLDVLVFQRVPYNNFTINLCENARAAGALVLFDTDDLNFKPWRRGEMGVIRSGAVSLNDESHAESLERRMKMMLRCDGAIVSTPYLQRELLSLGVNSILSRNALEDDMFVFGGRRLTDTRRDKSKLKLLFMSGSPTHDRDLATIESTLHAFLLSAPNVSLTLLGRVGDTHLQSLPNVHMHERVDRKEMVRIVSQHDVALVPLERTGFNTGKSSLKFIECSAAGVPVIASGLYEFKRDIAASGGGFICEDGREWLEALKRFSDDPELSYKLGEKCYRYAGANYTLSARGTHLRDEFLRFDTSRSQDLTTRHRKLVLC